MDRVPPKIDLELLHHDFPTPERLYKALGVDMKEIEKIDISKFEDWTESRLRYVMELPNGKQLQIFRDKTNTAKEISEINLYEKGKCVGEIKVWTDKSKSYYGDIDVEFRDDNSSIKYSYKKGEIKKAIDYNHSNGNKYSYNAEGNLHDIFEHENETTGIYRNIYVENGRIDKIVHRDQKTFEWLKEDSYDENGKIINETFNSALEW